MSIICPMCCRNMARFGAEYFPHIMSNNYYPIPPLDGTDNIKVLLGMRHLWIFLSGPPDLLPHNFELGLGDYIQDSKLFGRANTSIDCTKVSPFYFNRIYLRSEHFHIYTCIDYSLSLNLYLVGDIKCLWIKSYSRGQISHTTLYQREKYSMEL